LGQHFALVAAPTSAMGQQLLPLLYGCRRLCHRVQNYCFNETLKSVILAIFWFQLWLCFAINKLVPLCNYC